MKNLFFSLVLIVVFAINAYSQINVEAVQYRDCFACKPDNSKNDVLCNVGVEFRNSDKSKAYYLRLNQISYIGGDNCLWSTQTPTNQVRLRPNDGQAPGSTYKHQLDFDPWKNGCCTVCDGSIKITRLSIPIYDGDNANKVTDLVFEIRTCCGKEAFCTSDVFEVLKNSEMNIKVSPNPIINNNFNITLNSPISDEVSFKIIDLFGNSVFEHKQYVFEGENSTNLLINNNLPTGSYIIVVKVGNNNAYYDYFKIEIVK